jgi:(S)-ureidoglycine aminohydrolase
MARSLQKAEDNSFMQNLGFTRSSYQRNHLLLTPDTFVRAPLPGMTKCTAIVHTAPALGARFTQYTAEFEAGGSLGPVARASRPARFVYVTEGELNIGGPGSYAYEPAGVSAVTAAKAIVIEKEYVETARAGRPAPLNGHERDIKTRPLGDDPGLQVGVLIPEDPSFDFAVNTMTFAPGAALPMVEIHVMEHGLMMLQGGGIYRLGDHWYPVTAGDFIYMAPYCPQWFGAIGKHPAKYLIYKDWNR